MANRKLKIRWENHPSALQTMFRESLQSGKFVDVTLTSDDGQRIKCHRSILSACSTYFDRILSANPTDNVVFFLTNIKYWQLKPLVDFMYRGEVCVRQEQLQGLRSAAQELEIKGLRLPDGCPNEEEVQVGPPQGNADVGGQPIKRKMRTEPPELVTPKRQRVERALRSSGHRSALEDAGVGEAKSKRHDLEAADAGLVLPPKITTGRAVDADDRAERLKKASEFVVGGLSARSVAIHFDIPRSTLVKYMKRCGLKAKKDETPSPPPAKRPRKRN